MSLQNGPAPVEGYVPVVTLNTTLNSQPVPQQNLQLQSEQDRGSHFDHTVLLSQPLHSFTQIPGSDEQTLFILPAESQNDMLLKENQLLLLDLPGQRILQAGSVLQIHTPTLSLEQPSVELVQFPANAMFLTESVDQPVILCLQTAAQQISLQPQSLNNHTFVLDDIIHQTAASAEASLNQVALAKSWHYDADLVNRALTALNRQPVATTANIQFEQLHLNCSPGHRVPCDKGDRLLTLT